QSRVQRVIGIDQIINSVRNAGVPVAFFLNAGGQRDKVVIAPAPPDQLQTDRQAAIVETDRKRYRWQSQHVDEAAIATEIVQAPTTEVWRRRVNIDIAWRTDRHDRQNGRIRRTEDFAFKIFE